MKYTISIIFVFIPLIAFAALDVTFSDSATTLSVGGNSITVGDSSNVDSVTADTSSFDVTLSGGATISLTNAGGKEFQAPVENSVSKTTSCSGGSSSITLKQETAVGGTNTVTVTPSSTACVSSSSTASAGSSDGGGLIRSSSSGGGGGGAASAPVQVAQSASPSAPITAPATFIEFKSNLRRGMQDNDDVRRLQELLARDSILYPEGIVSGYFGPKTLAAVKRFQNAHGILATGLVGPLTRAKLTEIFGAKKGTITSTMPTPSQLSNQEKIKALLQQLQVLQEQLNALQNR